MDTEMKPWRAAARTSVKTISGVPLMADDFPATSHSPQVACLDLVAQADVVVHLAGRRYGSELPTGISATEAELQEARRLGKHVLSFLVCGTSEMEERQAALVSAMRDWQTGTISPTATSTDELIEKIGLAIQNLRSRPVREGAADAVDRALKIVLPDASHSGWTSAPWAGICWTPTTHAPIDDSILFDDLPGFIVDTLLTSPVAACDVRPNVQQRRDSIEITEAERHSQPLLRVHIGLDGTIAFAGAMHPTKPDHHPNAAFRAMFEAEAEAAELRFLQALYLGHAILSQIDPGRSVPEFLHQATITQLGHRRLVRSGKTPSGSVGLLGIDRRETLLAFDAPSSASREIFLNPAPYAQLLGDRLVRAAGDDRSSTRL